MKLCVCVAKETPELQLQGPHHRPRDGGGVTGLGLSFLGGAMSKHLFAAPPAPRRKPGLFQRMWCLQKPSVGSGAALTQSV